jgi:hypothetical protein
MKMSGEIKILDKEKPILFLGDHHGAWTQLLGIIEYKKISDCYLISVGDSGIGFIDNINQIKTINYLNDEFKPKSLYLDKKNFHMMIYNRWGEKVFDTTNPDMGWNGDVQNNPVVGTFNWIIECLDTRGVAHSKTGSVTVIR